MLESQCIFILLIGFRTPFGKTLRKLHIDYSECLSDIAEKLSISVPFLSSVEIGRKETCSPVGREEKIIEIYSLDQEAEELLRR